MSGDHGPAILGAEGYQCLVSYAFFYRVFSSRLDWMLFEQDFANVCWCFVSVFLSFGLKPWHIVWHCMYLYDFVCMIFVLIYIYMSYILILNSTDSRYICCHRPTPAGAAVFVGSGLSIAWSRGVYLSHDDSPCQFSTWHIEVRPLQGTPTTQSDNTFFGWIIELFCIIYIYIHTK